MLPKFRFTTPRESLAFFRENNDIKAYSQRVAASERDSKWNFFNDITEQDTRIDIS